MGYYSTIVQILRHSGMDDRQGWRKCGKQVGTCADWMPSFPRQSLTGAGSDGMTLNMISKG
jgi:hypothetical protein